MRSPEIPVRPGRWLWHSVSLKMPVHQIVRSKYLQMNSAVSDFGVGPIGIVGTIRGLDNGRIRKILPIDRVLIGLEGIIVSYYTFLPGSLPVFTRSKYHG